MGLFSNIFRQKSLTPVQGGGGWTRIFEPFMGAWQQNIELNKEDLLSFHAVFACISIVSKDIGKLPLELRKKENGVWVKVTDEQFPFFEKPNHFQTMQQFLEFWAISKHTRGNTYVLKLRNAFGKIEQLIVLNADNVTPLISEAGGIFYKIGIDRLAGQSESVILPASEIIHDRWNCLYHPLVGISPIVACGLSASQGVAIQKFSAKFFQNSGRPGGILTAPGKIDEADAAKIKSGWEENYSGANVGKTAVIGGDVRYIALSMPAADAQMIEQHKWSAEICCSVFNVPSWKVGIGNIPQGQKVEDMERIYLNSCLQSPIEAIENCLDDAFGLKKLGYEVFMDLSTLLRMDAMSQMNYYVAGVKGSLLTPNEGRLALNFKPLAGGDSIYIQQQNYSLEAISKRDAKDDPFAGSSAKKGDDDGADGK
ncbi:phage portal protein [Acinetobacter chinensis]|uniref:Phage portal protein n=1 Tax=Acinetobacter chinensis TaxID=2004650 RepID=A0A3B7LZ36_9GAMM|nr:phage portal protein [Acinetobacter chinensis]AXY57275.1 phage portal protein [Acinetobacter chinensis]